MHISACDEATTTPTEESLRRAIPIHLIINRKWGVARNKRPIQGVFVIDELTDLVKVYRKLKPILSPCATVSPGTVDPGIAA